MNLLKIAARIAVTRLAAAGDIGNLVVRTFEKYDVYPPRMKKTPGSDTYTGSVTSGYTLIVTDPYVEAPGLSDNEALKACTPILNETPYESLDQLVEEYGILFSIGMKNAKLTPNNGSVNGNTYTLNNYEYKILGSSEAEQIDIDLDVSGSKIKVVVSTNSSGPNFSSFMIDGTERAKEANAVTSPSGWAEIGVNAGEIFGTISAAVEHAASVKFPEIYKSGKVKDGDFHAWLRSKKFSIVNGKLDVSGAKLA
jgi:hypothetical protein